MKLHLVRLAATVLTLAAAVAGWLLLRPDDRPGRPTAGIADGGRAPDSAPPRPEAATSGPFLKRVRYRPHALPLDPSGFRAVLFAVEPWQPDAPLQDIARRWEHAGYRGAEIVLRQLADPAIDRNGRFSALFLIANLLSYEGEAEKSYQVLRELRKLVESDRELSRSALGTVIYLQGVMGLRQGENDNCLACQGDSACLLPIARSAVHTNPTGSRLAVRHFTEYLNQFPNNLEVRWLLNLAHMTLGEYPDKVDPRFRLDLSRFFHSEFDIGAFREISIPAKLGNRMNQSGGAIMDDFDNDGLLDVVITCHDPCENMAFYRNAGDGKFVDRTKEAGLGGQLGGLVCYQADYDNDGLLDVFIPRGAWHNWPMRPSLLRNRGGRFEDVTKAAGLLDPVNSNAAAWADYDNDGYVDLFVACEKQPNRLYRNRGNGTFEEVGARAGVAGGADRFAKGCSWLDYDNDGFPDLFVSNFADDARLYHNERDGRFFEVTTSKGIDGPRGAFSCWTFDYDNDGWLDIFAVAYDRPVDEVVKGMLGMPIEVPGNRLYRNLQGQKFQDVTVDAGLGAFFASMGSNFADFDNDGFLDMYLATGALNYGFLVPNRMLRNVEGKRFADISSSSRTGHLQKGHGVACGDWDRDGDVDLFVEMGGGVNGDRYHNLLFQNPGQGNHWLGVKLVGKKTNRAAIGARIKAVTGGPHPMNLHRVVTSGSSFGGNALEQTLGLARADRVATLEIHWPTSGTTQVFRDVPAGQSIEITELAEGYRRLEHRPVPEPR
ncbi:MAG: FG-GAP repeat domain-containing protein [Isosphaeraceae bacterium]